MCYGSYFVTNIEKNVNEIFFNIRLVLFKFKVKGSGAMVTLENCYLAKITTCRNIRMCSKLQKVFTDTNLGPSKAKPSGAALFEAKIRIHWNALVVLLFHHNISSVTSWSEQYIFHSILA